MARAFDKLPPGVSLMAILNITPDSFSDGGTLMDPGAAVEYALRAAEEGAAILDLGAEASSFFRPGIEPVPAHEQLRRLMPVLQRLMPQLPGHVIVSIDTRSAIVARAALEAGAHLINDISAGTDDPELLSTVARFPEAGLALMHISPTYPRTPREDDPSILTTVRDYLRQRAQAAMEAGIAPARIAIDPGLGFGKTMPDNWSLALHLAELLPCTIGIGTMIVGASRKRFLETPPPDDAAPAMVAATGEIHAAAASARPAAHPRDAATAALTALMTRRWQVAAGAQPPLPSSRCRLVHRVHDVTLARTALTMCNAR